MILFCGDNTALKGKPWVMLELTDIRRLSRAIKRLGDALSQFDDPVEVFVPDCRDFVFARCTHPKKLQRLTRVAGVVSIYGGSAPLLLEDAYVQSLIDESRCRQLAQHEGITIGSFVRILAGESQGFCGHVVEHTESHAVIHIELRSKSLWVETPLANLENLSHVPEEQRVYFYQPGVTIPPALLHYHEEELEEGEEVSVRSLTSSQSRDHCLTRFIMKLVLDGEHDPMTLARAVVRGIEEGRFRPAKNWSIVYQIIKKMLMLHVFPHYRDYRHVQRDHGDKYHITPLMIAGIAPQLGIPVHTPADKIVLRKERKYKPSPLLLKKDKQPPKRHYNIKPRLDTDLCGETGCEHKRKDHHVLPLTQEGARCLVTGCDCRRFRKFQRVKRLPD